jgi:hypothetical protein
MAEEDSSQQLRDALKTAILRSDAKNWWERFRAAQAIYVAPTSSAEARSRAERDMNVARAHITLELHRGMTGLFANAQGN